jgi:hypothetical protein
MYQCLTKASRPVTKVIGKIKPVIALLFYHQVSKIMKAINTNKKIPLKKRGTL